MKAEILSLCSVLQLSPKLYALEERDTIFPQKLWTEIRVLRSILGGRLLVLVDGQWQHLDSNTLKPQTPPTEQQQTLLLSDAVSNNPERYGRIVGREGEVYITSTGVELTLDWNTLKITQSGTDTKFIGLLYKIHYLQWLGNKQINTGLGIVGLLALSLLAYHGFILYTRRRREAS
ncbi:hypothetical protein EYC98_19940 [Halieaceae bacterium IMCC14734]|uniref:Uncharacterized protein n=1 Tax=Candidatus Litorirhabdus singularis TaxID=2518993 RepID=A0ABT3TLD9_9GAMM|nr:hypothetical protein [Candidatus Litorirhabdus singularis]MCX2983139.1 hypothetical protein [Candidatus Litorirhabdus singularis]